MKLDGIVRKIARMILLLLIVLAIIMFVGLRSFERKMIFCPMTFPEGYWETSQFPGQLEDCSFSAADGVRLHGWFAHAHHPRSASVPTLIFFHGNAGNITHRLTNIAYLIRLGMNVFIFDYRGYGKSEGSPNEQGVYADAVAAYEYVLSRNDVDKKRIVLFGRSLGGAVAVELATRKPCEKLILESTFTSIKDMATIMFGGLPLHYLVHTKFDSIAKIPTIRVPMLAIHGDQDSVVPFKLGHRLFEAANQPKVFYTLEGADHNDTYERGGQDYFDRIAQFIHDQ